MSVLTEAPPRRGTGPRTGVPAPRRNGPPAVTMPPSLTVAGGVIYPVPVGRLKLSDVAQRDLNWDWIHAMEKEFRWEAVGVIEVDQVPDGGLYVVDGGHRTQLVLTVHGPEALIPIHVHQVQSTEEHAQRYLDLNNRTAQAAQRLFHARVVNKDPAALQIVQTLKQAGMTVKTVQDRQPRAWYEITQPRALELIHKRCGQRGLALTVGLIARAWHDDPLATRADYLKGVAEFIRRYQEHRAWNLAKVVDRLRRVLPKQVLKEAKEMKLDSPGFSDIERLALTLLKYYNLNLKAGQKLSNPNLES